MEDWEGSWALQNTSSDVRLGAGVGTPGGSVRDARHAWVVPSCLLRQDLGVGRDLLLSLHLRPFQGRALSPLTSKPGGPAVLGQGEGPAPQSWLQALLALLPLPLPPT